MESSRDGYDYVLEAHHDRFGNPVPRFEVDQSLEGDRLGTFSTVTLGLSPRWDLTLGGRVDHYAATGTTHFSPRASASFAADDRFTLEAAVGLCRQRLPTFILSQKEAFGDLPETVGLVLGGEYLLTPSARFVVDAYWRGYDGFPIERKIRPLEERIPRSCWCLAASNPRQPVPRERRDRLPPLS